MHRNSVQWSKVKWSEVKSIVVLRSELEVHEMMYDEVKESKVKVREATGSQVQ